MFPSPAMGLQPTTLLVEVQVAPLLADIHNELAPLLRLVSICASSSSGKSPSPGPNGTSSGIGVNSSGFPGGEEEDVRGRHSPAISPVRDAESTLAELMAPVTVTVPPPMSSEDVASINNFVHHFHQQERYERDYIALIFQEYKKRKNIEKKYDDGFASVWGKLKLLRQRELPPEVRAALSVVVSQEAAARAAVQDAYDKFLSWVEETTPHWIEAAQRLEQQRVESEKAKNAAMAAAREALTQELLMGRQLGDVSGHSLLQKDGATPGRNKDGTLSYEPTVSVEMQMQASCEATEVLSPTQLRQKAIHMLEAEEAEMKRRREEQLRLLRVQEEQLRTEIALKAQHEQQEAARRERLAEKMREDEVARRYDALLEEEFTLQNRMRERQEAEARQESERRAKLARIAAEEEQLQRRILEREERRKALEEETARVEREKKMRDVREQEEVLRQRIAERTAALEAERRLREAEARVRAEAEAVRAQQEEALRQAKMQQQEREKQQQVAYLREQEEAYKRRIRERELAEIEERRRAADLLRPKHSAATTSAWAGHPVPLASTIPLAMPSGAAFPAPYTAPPQTSMSLYAPAIPPHGYQPMMMAPLPSAVAPAFYPPCPSAAVVPTLEGAGGMAPTLRPEHSLPPFAQSPSAPVVQPYLQPHAPAAAAAAGFYSGLQQNGSSQGAMMQTSPYAPAAMYTR
ncbi:hypothetical protein JKF63_03318 [Porcisia hertigi]|uniref:Uncharacterized protein n=1 Tax=Porcisia hertigi TaxID=2761500 RepID=A0A836I201_9TRYP|nr:hypothetical protein JKF63_03318 [Porcisia hertigi]